MYWELFVLAPAFARACVRMDLCKTLHNPYAALSVATRGPGLERHSHMLNIMKQLDSATTQEHLENNHTTPNKGLAITNWNKGWGQNPLRQLQAWHGVAPTRPKAIQHSLLRTLASA